MAFALIMAIALVIALVAVFFALCIAVVVWCRMLIKWMVEESKK